ncbi:MAG: glycosyltransferase family 4 protein [Patescibacteria group bacterium]
MDKKTILIITQRFYPDTFGGSGRVVWEQGRDLAARGYRVIVVAPRSRSNLLPEDTIDGMHVFRYQGSSWQKFFGQSFVDLTAGRREIQKIGEKFSVDLVILHHTFPAAAYYKTDISKKLPAIYIFHASLYRELKVEGLTRKIRPTFFARIVAFFLGQIAKKKEAEIFHRVKKILVFSDFSRRVLAETYPGAEDRVQKISGGVHESYLLSAETREAACEKLNLPFDRPILFVVRRLTPRMGLQNLISAIGIITDERQDVLLLIAGDGPLCFELKKLIQKNKLEANARLLGKITDEELRLYYRAADVFILPTLVYEGLGLATLEALASGLPVLGTAVGATPEILNQLDPELVMSDGSPKTMAKKILWFLDNKIGDEVLRESARVLAREKYSWEKSVDELELIINGLTN